jgi:hypothetical protein
VSCYRTTLEGRQLDRIVQRYPEATIVNPAGQFGSMAVWERVWPGILADLDWIVFFADDEGCIGGGVVREVLDACARCIPVEYLGSDGQVCPLEQVDLQLRGGDLRRLARVEVRRPSAPRTPRPNR